MKANLYQLLGVDPAATGEQIERAYRYAMEMYAEGSLATYSLLDPSEARETRTRIEQAYGVLSEPSRRRDYDAMLDQLGADPVALATDLVPPSEAPPVPPPSGAPLAALVPPTAAVRPNPGAGRNFGLVVPAPRVPVRSLAEPVTGPNLRRFRQEAGIDLSDIAAASKIGARFFQYIEEERFDLLPATVYLRGFLKEYARELGLDPMLIADAYLARVPKES